MAFLQQFCGHCHFSSSISDSTQNSAKSFIKTSFIFNEVCYYAVVGPAAAILPRGCKAKAA
jgi:hypothetical protein